jgi:hypothetical protein
MKWTWEDGNGKRANRTQRIIVYQELTLVTPDALAFVEKIWLDKKPSRVRGGF